MSLYYYPREDVRGRAPPPADRADRARARPIMDRAPATTCAPSSPPRPPERDDADGLCWYEGAAAADCGRSRRAGCAGASRDPRAAQRRSGSVSPTRAVAVRGRREA